MTIVQPCLDNTRRETNVTVQFAKVYKTSWAAATYALTHSHVRARITSSVHKSEKRNHRPFVQTRRQPCSFGFSQRKGRIKLQKAPKLSTFRLNIEQSTQTGSVNCLDLFIDNSSFARHLQPVKAAFVEAHQSQSLYTNTNATVYKVFII